MVLPNLLELKAKPDGRFAMVLDLLNSSEYIVSRYLVSHCYTGHSNLVYLIQAVSDSLLLQFVCTSPSEAFEIQFYLAQQFIELLHICFSTNFRPPPCFF